MDEKNKKIEQVSFDDLLKNYLVEAGEEITKMRLNLLI